ncbi:MAG: TIGR03746 family integrating conjugative element protein [Gammaproteobacteria bacterium]|nr:TIGR03746 family integrating conjugative element protein [Gammaproteobacteria bacterium]
MPGDMDGTDEDMKWFRKKPSRTPGKVPPAVPVLEAEMDRHPGDGGEAGMLNPDLRGLPHGLGYVNTAHTVMAINRSLLLANIILGAVCIALAVGLAQSREWITVYIPPDTARGSLQTAGTPGPATVYGFAGQVLQILNHWPVDGEADYAAAIKSQTPYLTPGFRRQLQEDYDRLRNRSGLNELRGRARALHPAAGRLYGPERVERLGGGVWGVEIEFRLVESIEASPIKDLVIRYAVRVVRADVNPEGNRWGLQLDGWIRDPVRIPDAAG